MSKNKGIILALTLSCLLLINTRLSAQQEQDSLIISLDQAIEIALEESNSIQIAELTIQKTGYAKKGTYASLYPNINARGSYQRTLKKQVMAMELPGQPPMEIAVGKWNNVNLGVNASMPVINAQLWQSLKLSSLNVEMAVEQARSSKISMIAKVKQSYYAVLLAQEMYDVYKEVYDNAKNNFDQAQKKYNAGKLSEYEFLRAQVNVSNAEPNVYSALAAIDLAIWQLKAVMGIDLSTKIGISGNLDEYKDEMLVYNLNDTIDLNNNSSLIQLDMQEKQIDISLKMTKFQYIPTLSAAFSYSYMAMGDNFDMIWNPYSTLGVSLSIPIFDGFSKHNSIKQSKVSKDIIKMNREDTERNLNIAVKNYNNQMSTYMKNYIAAESTLEMAQKSYDIASKMYELGKATLVELNDAQLALVQAQLTMSQAIYNFMVAKASLNEIAGLEY